MRIESIAVAHPSREITNDYVSRLVAEQNSSRPKHVVEDYQRKLSHLFRIAGTRRRLIRDRAAGESVIDLVRTAADNALRDSSIHAGDLDMVISCGVSRGFLEPATAYFFAEAIGASCECFDVSDACMGWTRAIHIAYNLLRGRSSNRIMVISAEFNVYEYGFPEVFEIEDDRHIDRLFPSYTIGETAVATVLSGSDDEWLFRFTGVPSLVHNCACPLGTFQEYLVNGSPASVNGVKRLFADGPEMLKAAKEHLVPLIKESVPDVDSPKLWFPHVPSRRYAGEIARLVGVDDRRIITESFENHGNLISASIPTAMAETIETNRLRRGDDVVLCPSSAGMSFGVVRFRF